MRLDWQYYAYFMTRSSEPGLLWNNGKLWRCSSKVQTRRWSTFSTRSTTRLAQKIMSFAFVKNTAIPLSVYRPTTRGRKQSGSKIQSWGERKWENKPGKNRFREGFLEGIDLIFWQSHITVQPISREVRLLEWRRRSAFVFLSQKRARRASSTDKQHGQQKTRPNLRGKCEVASQEIFRSARLQIGQVYADLWRDELVWEAELPFAAFWCSRLASLLLHVCLLSNAQIYW